MLFRSFSISKVGELKMIGELGLAIPENLLLIRDAKLRILSKSPLPKNQAYYLFSNGVWKFLGKTAMGSDAPEFAISSLGRVAVMEDGTAPSISFNQQDQVHNGKFIQFEIRDYGSGIDPASVQVFDENESLETKIGRAHV